MAHQAPDRGPDAAPSERRSFLGTASSVAMAGGLLASYGTFAVMAARYLYPATPNATAWMFVADIASFKPGSSLTFKSPSGASIAIARQGATGSTGDFIALSSTCPHLGCQVHWEAQNNRFFCPCHNGTFDLTGKATGGPPGEAGQALLKYPIKIERGLLYVEVPTGTVASAAPIDPQSYPRGPGHDPCLAPHARAPAPGQEC